MSYLRSTLFVIVGIIFFGFSIVHIHAADPTAPSDIDAKKSTIASLQAQIQSYQSQLNTLADNKQSLKNTLAELSLSQKKIALQIRLTNQKIDAATLRIKTLSSNITLHTATIHDTQKVIGKSLKSLNDTESSSFTEQLLNTTSIADISRLYTATDTVKNSLEDKTIQVSQEKVGLETKKTTEEKAKSDLIGLQRQAQSQKSALDDSIREQNRLIKETSNQESTYHKQIDATQALVDSYEAEVRAYESSLKFTIDSKTIPASGTAVFAWPLDDVFITQMFGRTVDSVRLYASGSHSGTDFRASIGTPVYAMASGTVEGTGNTDTECRGASFGKWVYIHYDNGLGAAFGHLSGISVSTGDRVSANDTIGYSGMSGHATGPHLHVSVYVAAAVQISGQESRSCKGRDLVQPRAAINAYLDPLAYMPRTTRAMFKSR